MVFPNGCLRFVLAAAFAICCSVSLAQPGPDLSCEDCPEFFSPPFPETGIWGNPDQPGFGFMLEVQDGKVGGFHFGYDEAGAATWFIVVGDLAQTDDPIRAWHLKADLEIIEGGPCLNCPWQPFEAPGSAGEVEFVFEQRAFGRYRVDDGEWQNIQPLVFGVLVQPLLAEQTPYLFPTLEGYWSITIELDQEFVSRAVWIGNLTLDEENSDTIRARLFKAEKPRVVPSPAPMIVGELVCGPQPDAASPLCVLELNEFDTISRMPVTALTDSYFRAESEQGGVLEAHRLDYD